MYSFWGEEGRKKKKIQIKLRFCVCFLVFFFSPKKRKECGKKETITREGRKTKKEEGDTQLREMSFNQTQTPCGFLLVGTGFSSWRGDPNIRLLWPVLLWPLIKQQKTKERKMKT